MMIWVWAINDKEQQMQIQKKNTENALEVNLWGSFTQISNR